MSDEPLKAPKPTGGDAAISISRAIVGSIPFAGAALTELFNWFVRSPLERRWDEWVGAVAETLKRLESRGVGLEALQKDEAFVDVIMQATHIAMRNHQEEKREALRNAIANSALPDAPEESKRQMFLQFIDRFTVSHLRFLNLFADPKRWISTASQAAFSSDSAMSDVISISFPEFTEEGEFSEQLWKDLVAAGVAMPADLRITHLQQIRNIQKATQAGAPPPALVQVLAKRTTPFGDEFLSFISEPAELKAPSRDATK